MNSEIYNRKNDVNIKYIKRSIQLSKKNTSIHPIPIIITHYPPSKCCSNLLGNYNTMYYNITY